MRRGGGCGGCARAVVVGGSTSNLIAAGYRRAADGSRHNGGLALHDVGDPRRIDHLVRFQGRCVAVVAGDVAEEGDRKRVLYCDG